MRYHLLFFLIPPTWHPLRAPLRVGGWLLPRAGGRCACVHYPEPLGRRPFARRSDASGRPEHLL